jgi:hypothetical protein
VAVNIDTGCGAPVFSALAADPTMYAGARVYAALCVIRYDKEDAADLLVSLASDRGLSQQSRVRAARSLVDLDPARAAAVCTSLLEKDAFVPYLRIGILDMLTRLGDQPAEDLHEWFILDIHLDSFLERGPRNPHAD